MLALTLPSFAQQVSRESEARSALNERVQHIDRQLKAGGMISADVLAALLYRQTNQTWVDTEWVNSSRTTNTYSGEVLVESLTETWDGDSWEPSSRTVYVYSSGRLMSITNETFVGGAWTGEYRTVFSYSGDRITETVSQVFENNAWVNEDRVTVTLTNGDPTGGLTESWTGSAWEPEDRYTVMEEGNDVVLEFQEWNGSAWVNSSRTVYPNFTIESLYDFFEEFVAMDEGSLGFGTLMRFPDSIEQEWDGSQWVNVSRQVSERNGQGLPVTVTYEDWDGSAWTGDTRFAATYDSEGRITKIEFQQFSGTWMGFLVENFTYDSEGLLAEIVTQLDFGFGAQNSSRILFEYTGGGGTAIGDESVPGEFLLKPLYPNPFNPEATVAYRLDVPAHARISIYDALGRHVSTLVDGMHAAGSYEVTFDAAGRPSGTYIVRLETASGAQTRTVTLMR